MASLTDKQINNTYKGLIKTSNNTEISGPIQITDGDGNSTGITISNDGQVTTNGTVTFGSLKDGGENITISKFVDEADGISNNNNDTSIPTSAAIIDYIEGQITLDDLDFSADEGTGSVDLDSQVLSISGGNNVSTQASGQSVTINADGTNLGSSSTSTVVNITSSTGGSTSIESATSTNAGVFSSSDKIKLDGITAGAEVNPNSTDDLSEGSTNLYYTEDRVSANSDVVANTAKVGITAQQSADITANNAKVGITTQQASDIAANNDKISFDSASSTKLAGIEAGAEVNTVDSVNGATGSVFLGTANLADVATTSPSNGQVLQYNSTSSEYEPSTLDLTGLVDSVNGYSGDVVLDTDDIDEGDTNLYYTEARVSANTSVAANTAKNSYPTADAAKVGFISVTQAVDLDTIESDVATNNAKISFDSASSTKLAGIEEGAEVNVNADWNATSGDAEILNKPTLATVATTGAYSDLSGTPSLATVATSGSYNDLSDQPTIPTNNNQLTNGAGYITDGNTGWDNTYGFITASSTDTLTNKSGSNSQWTNDAGYINEAAQTTHSNAIGKAIDFSARVTLDGGVAEGTSAIIKNLQNAM